MRTTTIITTTTTTTTTTTITITITITTQRWVEVAARIVTTVTYSHQIGTE